MSNSDPETNLVWIDLEMTGLDWEIHRIMEIMTIITNKDLEILAEGPDIIIHQSEAQLALMDPTIIQAHLDSGLTESSRKSTVSEKKAEAQTLEFIKKYCAPRKGVLCGNGIYMDKAFLYKYMKDIENYLYYHTIDVHAIQELYKRWRPGAQLYTPIIDNHRASSDIKSSIDELKFYRETRFITP